MRADAMLAGAMALVERLHATCCEPGRSPRMEQLLGTLTAARDALLAGVTEAQAVLAEAGAEVGWLQVACCAEKRMPLYAEILENLSTVHRTLQQHDH